MSNKLAVLIILASILISGCALAVRQQNDPFYIDNGAWDFPRIPLIKPYYMIYTGDEFGWQMPLLANPPSKGLYYYYKVDDIQKLDVENGVLMIYTPFNEPVDASKGQRILHWFAIVPDRNIEEGFDNEADFLNYIHIYNIQQPLWEEPASVIKQFGKTGCLDWIPDCK